jgi:hypothetical protein
MLPPINVRLDDESGHCGVEELGGDTAVRMVIPEFAYPVLNRLVLVEVERH